MGDARQHQAQLDALLGGFVARLLHSASAHVTRPIAPASLGYFRSAGASDPEVTTSIECALDAASLALLGRPHEEPQGVESTSPMEPETVALAAAMLDLAALTDPEIGGLFAGRARAKIRAWAGAILETVGPPTTRAGAVERHAIVGPFLGLRRHDRTVKNWAYTYRFFGRPVPARVVALPRVRRVRVESVDVPFERLVYALPPELDALALYDGIRARSPITVLLRLGDGERFILSRAILAVLADDALRSGIRFALQPKLAAASGAIGGAVTHGAASVSTPALGPLLWLATELLAIDALDAPALPPAELVTPDQRFFAALLPATLAHERARDELLSALAPADRAHLRARAAELTSYVGRDTVAAAHAIIAAAFAAEVRIPAS